MDQTHQTLIELISKTKQLLKSNFSKNTDKIRQQLTKNYENIIPFKTWLKDSEFDKGLVSRLIGEQEKLEKWFNKNWVFKHEKTKYLHFDEIYESQTKIGIEWHANTAIPHIYKYLIKFEPNGFFKIKIAYPDHLEEAIQKLQNSKINYSNLYNFTDKGIINMASEHFNMRGRIIGYAIIDESINLRDYRDRERFTDPKMLTVYKRKNGN